MVAHAWDASSGRQRQADLWGLLTSQSSLLEENMPQENEQKQKENKKQMDDS